MKHIFLLVALTFIGHLFGQNELTVERIWKSPEFYAKGVDGFASLPDGEHFTKMVNEGGSLVLKKYSFKDFNGSGTTLVNFSDIKVDGKQLEIDDAFLNKEGTLLLLMTKTRWWLMEIKICPKDFLVKPRVPRTNIF